MLCNRFLKLAAMACVMVVAAFANIDNAIASEGNNILFKIQDVEKIELPNGKNYCSFDIYFKNNSGIDLKEFGVNLEWDDNFDVDKGKTTVIESIGGGEILSGQQVIIKHKTETPKCFLLQDEMTATASKCVIGKRNDVAKCKGIFKYIKPFDKEYFANFELKKEVSPNAKQEMTMSEFDQMKREINALYGKLEQSERKTVDEINSLK